jgi:type I restriction enzyme S subunit
MRVTVQLHGRGVVQRDTVLGGELITKKQQVLRAGDFLVAEIDAKMGGFGIVPRELDGSVVSSHYFVFEVDEALALRSYLDALTKHGFITAQILRFVRGSLNYAAIRARHVEAISFPFAPLRKQAELSERLRVVASMRVAAEAQLATIEALPGAILRQAFSSGVSERL